MDEVILFFRKHIFFVVQMIRKQTIFLLHATALFSWLKFSTFSPLSPSHHIKYGKRHMFGVLNISKK
jgi:hypothetical protein